MNRGFAGAYYDSTYYLKMFEYLGHFGVIPAEKYQVASSPIFVHLVGNFLAVIPIRLNGFLHFVYMVIALASILTFSRLIRNLRFSVALTLMVLFTSSGYFVAPSLSPTSDAPAILFALLTLIYSQTGQSIKFAISGALLVSTRQNLAWIVIGIFAWELINARKKGKNYFDLSLKYIPSLISLLITFIYFGFNLTIPNYAISSEQNSFSVPNYMSIVQIFFALFFIVICLSPLNSILMYSRFKLTRDGIVWFFLSMLPLAQLTHLNKRLIGDGLGWLSVFLNRFQLPLITTICLSTICFNFCVVFLYRYKFTPTDLSSIMLLSFVIFSVLMPIPFLRYFEIYLIMIVSFSGKFWNSLIGKLTNRQIVLALGLTIGMNYFKILS